MKSVRFRLLLCAWALCVLPEIVWAGIIQGPVKGTREARIGTIYLVLTRHISAGMATGAFDSSPDQTFENQITDLRRTEDAVSFPYALSELYEAISHNDGARVTHIIKGGAFLDGWGKNGQGPYCMRP